MRQSRAVRGYMHQIHSNGLLTRLTIIASSSRNLASQTIDRRIDRRLSGFNIKRAGN